ncbi:peptidase S8 [Lutibacter profundi]|uniref:Peptidase S8 n=1 Tax=Lutibacter profundi TaxID=1622118 RepID=A0A0X8G913_9FLAO|nr:S8 family peptidase [Lutibacter profundi]AMC11888.1 peptidase S8 [Lutibacter profundi]
MKTQTLFTKFSFLTLFLVSILIVITSCVSENEDANITDATSLAQYTSTPIDGQYVIVFNNNYAGKSAITKSLSYKAKTEMLKSEIPTNFAAAKITNENIINTFGFALNGFSAKLTESQLAILKKDNRIKSIEQDQMITLSPINAYIGKPGSGGGTPPAQEIPWGITRVGGGAAYSGGATAWIIDTGIDLDHPELNVDVARSISFLTGSPANKSPEDQNGHGTHVAGTVAAIDNAIGVVGVAPGATVVAVRVLDRRGSGSTSGVISGIDYVAANGQVGDAANMSLGGGVSTALDDAVIAAAATGVKFALAAGNESTDANSSSPGRANGPNIYTISAMDVNDNFASFSNYGNPPIEFCAPGVSILSTWKDGGYNTISGTSMATPHVCGLLLLGNVNSDGTVNGDPDGNPDAIAHN